VLLQRCKLQQERIFNTENLRYNDVKAEIYGTVTIWQPEYFGFFAGYIYVNFAQNHNFKLVTMNGYAHNQQGNSIEGVNTR
jgi:hypothetical protein